MVSRDICVYVIILWIIFPRCAVSQGHNSVPASRFRWSWTVEVASAQFWGHFFKLFLFLMFSAPFAFSLTIPSQSLYLSLSLSPALFHLLFFSLRYFSLCFQHISDPCCLIPKILLWVKSACFSPLGFSPDLSDYVLPQFFLFVVSTVYFVLGHIFISSLKFFFFLIYVFGWMYLFASTSSISDR